jgi:hypothetical protein
MSDESLASGDDVYQFTTFTSDINLSDGSISRLKRPARYLRVEDVSGGTTLSVRLTSSNADRVMTVGRGFELIGKIQSIKLATTVSRVTVIW